MSFVQQTDHDLERLQSNPRDYQQNYLYNQNCIARRTIFYHTIILLKDIKAKTLKLKQEASRELEITDIPNLTIQDQAITLSKQGIVSLRNILHQEQSIRLTPNQLFSCLLGQNKCQVIFITVMHLLEITCKLILSVFLQNLFSAVSLADDHKYKMYAYFLAIICGVIWLISQVSAQNAYYQIAVLILRIRSQLTFLIYLKLSNITQYTAKSQHLGKIVHLISNQFNSFQSRGYSLFSVFVVPFGLAGVVGISVYRFGWPALILVVVFLVFVPLQVLVGKMNSLGLEKINLDKDKRITICTEIIEGIKLIKLYGWEMALKHMIEKIREQQTRKYIYLAFGKSLQRALGVLPASLAAFTCFVTMDTTGMGSGLTTAKIISTMGLMITFKVLISHLAVAIGFLLQLRVIFERFCDILNIQDKRMIKIDPQTKEPMAENFQCADTTIKKGEIVFRNFNGYWKTDQLTTPTLHNINLSIKPGKLVGIVGKVGSGKSGLLGVVLDEIPYYSGSIEKNGSVAYVEQEPIIFSATIKENILFGRAFDKQLYNRVVNMSCLDADMEILEDGDRTLVGERGITLSGGQKARLALARALYFDADIYLLDDPISAVDSKVAKKIYDNVILKMKGTKTVILVTHQISYMYGCDEVVIMEDGKVAEFGNPENLRQKLNYLELVEKELINNKQEIEEEAIYFQQQKQQQSEALKQNLNSKKSSVSALTQEENPLLITNKSHKQFVKVSWRSFLNYIFYSSKNSFLFPVCILFFVLAEIMFVLYLRLLSQYDLMKVGTDTTTFSKMSNFWFALGLLLLSYFIFNIIKIFLLNIAIANSNEQLHNSMVSGLLRTHSSYFDLTSTGHLNNKFSNDLGILDSTLAFVLRIAIESPIAYLILIGNVFSINLYFLIPGILNIIFIMAFFMYCKQAILMLKQFDLKLKTPVFNMIGQLISGLIPIKIFGRRFHLLSQYAQKINCSFRGALCFLNVSRAFGANINYVSLIFMWIGMVIGVRMVTPQTAGLYSVSVMFFIQIMQYLQWFLRQIIAVQEVFLIAELQPEKQLKNYYDQQHDISCGIDRVKYGKIEQDRNQFSGSQSLTQQWPLKATIKLENFSMKYREGLPLVLKNICFEIRDGEKVGIVGRTGAGKSSIIQAVFRICEPEVGSVYQIGGCDAFQMGLHSLRQNISVIPQTPFLFKGTIKANLDPFEVKSDLELWEVLEQSDLKQAVEKLPDKLLTDVTNISEVFSVGQKQLLCLARALLRKNKFLVLDEATSNVDMMTDHFIQECIKTKFAKTTVITIAHRLNTIADYDKVIVMDQGRIAEIGSPYELLMKGGMFAEMVQHTGRNADMIKKLAREKFEGLKTA